MMLLLLVAMAPLIVMPVVAQAAEYIASTEQGTLDVRLSYEDLALGELGRLDIDFINPQTLNIQDHIDYTVTVSKDGNNVFGPIPMAHTTGGSIKIPVEFAEKGTHDVYVEVSGILFEPIPAEGAMLQAIVGDATGDTTGNAKVKIPTWIKNIAGYWHNGQISDDEYLNSIGWLVSNGFITLPESKPESEAKTDTTKSDTFEFDVEQLKACQAEVSKINDANRAQQNMLNRSTTTQSEWDEISASGNEAIERYNEMDCANFRGGKAGVGLDQVDLTPFDYWYKEPKPSTYKKGTINLLPNPEDIPGLWQMGDDNEKHSYTRERIPDDTWTQQALDEIGGFDTFAKADYKRMPTKDKDRTYVTLELTKFRVAENADAVFKELKYYNEPDSKYFEIIEDFGVCYQLSYSVPGSFSNRGSVLCSYANMLISSHTAEGDWYSDTTALWEVTSPVLDDLANAVGVPDDWRQAVPEMERDLENKFVNSVDSKFLNRLKAQN